MTPEQKADELVSEAERICATHDGCHSLPSLLYDLRVHRKHFRSDNPEYSLGWMEYIIASMRRRVGLLS